MKGNTLTLNSFNDTGRSTPISRDRRRFLGGIAASCAGLAGTAIASSNPLPPSPAAAQAALHAELMVDKYARFLFAGFAESD
jgi:hypothetical protein